MEKIPWDQAVVNSIEYLHEQNFKRLEEIEELEKEVRSLKENTEKLEGCKTHSVHTCESEDKLVRCVHRVGGFILEKRVFINVTNEYEFLTDCRYCPFCGEKS